MGRIQTAISAESLSQPTAGLHRIEGHDLRGTIGFSQLNRHQTRRSQSTHAKSAPFDIPNIRDLIERYLNAHGQFQRGNLFRR